MSKNQLKWAHALADHLMSFLRVTPLTTRINVKANQSSCWLPFKEICGSKYIINKHARSYGDLVGAHSFRYLLPRRENAK